MRTTVALDDDLVRITQEFTGVAEKTALITIGGVAGRSSAFNTPLRSEHAKPAVVPVPGDMMVVVTDDGKTFHAAGCRFIHDKAHLRTIAA